MSDELESVEPIERRGDRSASPPQPAPLRNPVERRPAGVRTGRQRKRNWCFTIYGEFDETSELDLDRENFRFVVWQLERCPSSGRLHFQGYCEFGRSIDLHKVKEYLRHPTAHLEARRGSRASAIDYCRKDESRVAGPWEFGREALQQGKRTDLDGVVEALQSGESLSQVREQYPKQYIQYRNGINSLFFDESRKRSKEWRTLEVLVYYGEAGTGKTRKAVEDCGDDYYILDQSERVWFDGYEGDKNLIIDDFYGWVKYGMLLRILDGYQYRCEVKGGFTYAEWTKVIITSNVHPRDWYERGLTDALKRRLTTITHFNTLT